MDDESNPTFEDAAAFAAANYHMDADPEGAAELAKRIGPNAPNARDCEHGQLRRSCQTCEDAARIAELEAENARLRVDVTTATETAKYILTDLGEHMEPFCDKLTDAKLASAREAGAREFAEWLTEEENITLQFEAFIKGSLARFLASGTGLASEKGNGGE